MQIANHITSTTTQVSGAVTIGSALTSRTAEYVTSSGAATQEMAQKASEVIVSSEQLALWSFIVMLISLLWNIYNSQRKHKADQAAEKARAIAEQKDRELREREIRLEEKKLRQSQQK